MVVPWKSAYQLFFLRIEGPIDIRGYLFILLLYPLRRGGNHPLRGEHPKLLFYLLSRHYVGDVMKGFMLIRSFTENSKVKGCTDSTNWKVSFFSSPSYRIKPYCNFYCCCMFSVFNIFISFWTQKYFITQYSIIIH